MKLKNAYIENYGGISGKQINFEEGITQICENNGYGKTTLASFIRAAFYGLPSYKVNSVEFNDREKFYPFNGGKFGGNLSFEFGGKNYKIERFFDKKSSVKDELKLYENGELVPADYDLGKRFFGLDERAFSRTVFFGGDDDLSGGIAVKLGNFVEDNGGVTYEQAASEIEKSIKKYKALRGDAGLLKDYRNKKRALGDKVADLKAIEKTLADKYADRAATEAEAKALSERYQRAVERETNKARRENYERYKAKIAANSATIEDFRRKYPCGVPSEKETEAAVEEYRKIIADTRSIEAEKPTPAKEYELEILKSNFKGGVPDEKRISQLRSETDMLAKNRTTAERFIEEYDGLNADPLITKFDANPVDGGDFDELEEKTAEYREIEERRRVASENAVPQKEEKSRSGLIIAILGVLAVIGGVALLWVNLYAAIAVLAAGVIAIAIGAAGGAKRKPAKNLNAASEALVKENMLREEINEILAKYGYYSRDGVAVGYSKFTGDYNRYVEMKNALAEKRRYIDELEEKNAAEEKRLKEIFSGYGINCDNLADAYTVLVKDVERYAGLLAQSRARAEKIAGLKAEIEKSKAYVASFMQAYKLTGDLKDIARTLQSDRFTVEKLKRENGEYTEAVEKFKEKYGETEPANGDTATVEELASAISELNKKLAQKTEAIAADEAALENLPDYESRLDVCAEELAKAEENYALLKYTGEYLAKAEKTLKDEYVAPVMQEFLKYAALTEEALGVGVDMDKDFCVRFERNGEYRSEKHLSAGQRAVLGLCLRLAIAKHAFKTEKPFVVMDDPFVVLDGEHFKRVSGVVKQLAENEQIIYFTCHPSRVIS